MEDNTKHEQALIGAVGRQIAAERVAIKMSQETLAERVGISKKSVTRYELGERDPQLGTLVAIADALGVPVTQLLLAAAARAEHDTSAPKSRPIS